MQSRRSFLKKAAMLAGASAAWTGLPGSIKRAFAINPDPGTTVFDAEHVVILMQENRSFDHCFGTLQGVRGFNDRRAFRLPNGNPVWLQTNENGDTYAPFRLDMHETKATWMNGLLHTWPDQVDARNGGRCDKWLDAKKYAGKLDIPFTLGYYARQDIPFYYAMADAFTICDQHFCSSLTGTMPNRLYLWTGTIRSGDASTYARVFNKDTNFKNPGTWLTFPEVLEDNGISWKVYQNELGVGTGFTPVEWSWLANYFDNPLEDFVQYRLRFHQTHRKHTEQLIHTLPLEIDEMKRKLKGTDPESQEFKDLQEKLQGSELLLKESIDQHREFTSQKYEKLSEREKNLHRKAFCTNVDDPNYRKLIDFKYREGDEERTMQLPKGDVLHQFRQDVAQGSLPTVSWIVPPQNFSDHPSSPWYGAWFVSEVLDILTKNKEVWKKTVFILTYDENDGYFDHIPPFVAPHFSKKDSGAVSEEIDTAIEYVTLEQELKRKRSENELREGPIGLGYRVPMIVASPWSRGGFVNSQVFDHTSTLQFLEKFLTKKSGKKVHQTPITAWRRTVCGDLSSIFRPYQGEEIKLPAFIERDPFVKGIHEAQFKNLPNNFKKLSNAEISEIKANLKKSPLFPQQEAGTRPACALPYELYADARLDDQSLEVEFAASKEIFGELAAGAPFQVYARNYKGPDDLKFQDFKVWSFAVSAGDKLKYPWRVQDFSEGKYALRIDGPNGFMREFVGKYGLQLQVRCEYVRKDGVLNRQLSLQISCGCEVPVEIEIRENAYGLSTKTQKISKGENIDAVIDCASSLGWYDVTVSAADGTFQWTFAGRIENGIESITDPAAV